MLPVVKRYLNQCKMFQWVEEGTRTSREERRIHEMTRAENKENTDVRDFENKKQKEFGVKGL